MAEVDPIRVLVWDEAPPHAPKSVYPDSINAAVAEGLRLLEGARMTVTTANLDDPDQGCSEQALANANVILWWGHARHGQVTDETADRVTARVLNGGVGFVALHSAHYSKPFQRILSAPGHLKGGWRELDPMEPEVVRVCAPWHPIAAGVGDFTIEHEEMYGAPFDVPPALTVVLQSHFPYDGKTVPSGICWTVGPGKTEGFTSGPGGGVGEGFGSARVFYFRPGHETVPTYFDPSVRRVLANAVLWCAHRT
ncbi:MAG: trehalose utilization protein ThuA [Armatimonadetes bacterium]|nr:trehalose utilization protein ThuA [Armatimonadota bacterium]